MCRPSLTVVPAVRPQWDVQTFEDTHGVRKTSNLQPRQFSLRALVTICVPCFSVPCPVNGSHGANELSGISREGVPQKTDASGKMIRVGEMFWVVTRELPIS